MLPGSIKSDWGETPAGEPVHLFTLQNGHGMQVRIATYGGIVVGLRVPDRLGQIADVVLGFDSLDGYSGKAYRTDCPYFGALIGRYANQIAKAQFQLHGDTVRLFANNGIHHLHGGLQGFDQAIWHAVAKSGPEPNLTLKYISRHGEEGYPGTLEVTVVFTLSDNNELKVAYLATTDRDTLANLTHHGYFNLKGHGEGDILGHELLLRADHFTPVDADLIPTGEICPVRGTAFDFTQPMTIGSRIESDEEQLRFGKGYDHNFVLTRDTEGLSMAARLSEPTTGRVMELWTTEPGLQLYTGNCIPQYVAGKNSKLYGPRSALCLETQHFPDSPNHPQFPSTLVTPAKPYRSTTLFKFRTDNDANRHT